ncbi:hypothetical protein D7309_07580 [Legionella pneumophila]|nr:hypothetical protein D7266_07280 [Legionella pneumophila]RYV87857.1 hypothetical protein D7313_05840 [Legionella pneumophila]RYV94770.1 hypothetical protein D7309_07580 [Legionella pneumophila]RYW00377.1 hypothetical protein D7317_06045 [Legionella pneumophila]RYW71215.1 hypothetical protein D7314_15100 [Legionella pneumophila]
MNMRNNEQNRGFFSFKRAVINLLACKRETNLRFLNKIRYYLQAYKKYTGQKGQVGHTRYDWAIAVPTSGYLGGA